MAEEEVQGQVRGFDYERFCTYPVSEVLGAEVQDEYLYLVQPQKISVYEYYGQVKKPQLIEELIYNKLILNYSINSLYICIQTSTFIEVRDRHNWNKLIYTHPITQGQNNLDIFLQDHSLFISISKNEEVQLERIDILIKQLSDVIELGKINREELVLPFSGKPVILSQMGALNDFYIWVKDHRTIELGMLYTQQDNHKNKFQICSIELKQQTIRNFYHHRVKCAGSSTRYNQYLIIVAQSNNNKQICLVLYQILPNSLSFSNDPWPHNFQERINQQLDHLTHLQDDENRTTLVNETLDQAFKSMQKNCSSSKLEFLLKGTTNFESSFYQNNKLWIFTPERICQIELISETYIEEMIKQVHPRIDKVIRSITHQTKPANKKAKGIYQDNILFFEQTTSFLVGTPKQPSESIAEEITQEPQVEEELNGNYQQMEELCNDIIEATLTEKHVELINKPQQNVSIPLSRSESKKPLVKLNSNNNLHSRVYSESHHHLSTKSNQFAVQTDELTNKVNNFDEVERLVAKYSSTFSVSCSKIKQNQFQKDKFDRQIGSIVESMAKTIIEPYLQSKFVTILEAKVKQMSLTIGGVLRQQLQVLNEAMRKIQVKENNLRGKRIYDYSKQVQNIKNSVSGVVDSLKEREINKLACNELILEEATAIKQRAKCIEKEIIELSTKQSTSESEIQTQIGEIMELMTKLNNKPYVEESEEEMECSGEESSQGEKEQRYSEGTDSQRSSSFQENQNQGRKGYHPRHPAFHNLMPYQYKEKHQKIDSQRYPMPGYYPQFLPPPPHPHTPYYYPYGAAPATVPYQPYYSSTVQHGSVIRAEKSYTSNLMSRKDKEKRHHKKNK